MTCKILYDELESGLQWASGDALDDQGVYVDLETGKTYWTPDEGLEPDMPEDLERSDRYLRMPTKRDLDLGSGLPRRFAWDHLSEHEARLVEDCFSRKGAYRCFKSLLERFDKLDAWHAYEDAETRAAIEAWAEEHGIEVVDRS